MTFKELSSKVQDTYSDSEEIKSITGDDKHFIIKFIDDKTQFLVATDPSVEDKFFLAIFEGKKKVDADWVEDKEVLLNIEKQIEVL